MYTYIRTIREVQSGDETIPPKTRLRVIMQTDREIQAVDSNNHVHNLKPLDYEPIPDNQEYNGAEIYLR